MKIKEKGLSGKAAVNKKEAMNKRGFNAYREMSRSGGGGGGTSSADF